MMEANNNRVAELGPELLEEVRRAGHDPFRMARAEWLLIAQIEGARCAGEAKDIQSAYIREAGASLHPGGAWSPSSALVSLARTYKLVEKRAAAGKGDIEFKWPGAINNPSLWPIARRCRVDWLLTAQEFHDTLNDFGYIDHAQNPSTRADVHCPERLGPRARQKLPFGLVPARAPVLPWGKSKPIRFHHKL